MTGKTVSRAKDKRRAKNCGILLRASALLHMLDETDLANDLESLAVSVRNGDRIPDPQLLPGVQRRQRGDPMTATTTTDLDRLAVLAETTANSLHDALCEVQDLRARMLLLIEEMGGDRTYNWDLQADLGHAETAIWSVSQKARQVARHARTPREDNP